MTTRTPTPTPTQTSARTTRRHATRGAAVIAVALVLLTGCGAEAPAEPNTTDTAPPAATPPAPQPAPEPPREDDAPEEPDVAADPLPGLVARTSAQLDVFDAPGDTDPATTLPATTAFGTTTTLLVLHLDDPAVDDSGSDSPTDGDAESWAEVLLPVRPNGSTGWIRTDDVELREVDVEVVVDLDERELTVVGGDEVLLTTAVAVGDADHPTPTGRFFVTDKLDTGDVDGPYGPFALGLSGYSDVLTEFAGGEGQIGIHGTNDPDSIGEAASKGCIRVPNDVAIWLAEQLPLGTPVLIQ